MLNWQLAIVAKVEKCLDENGVFAVIEEAALGLGFEYCAYGLRVPFPVSSPRVSLLSNYPDSWKRRYLDARYLDIDPTVRHGRRSRRAVIWAGGMANEAPQLFDEASSIGLRHGWAMSSLDEYGVVGMLTLARGQELISPHELASKQARLHWLAQYAHVSLAEKLRGQRQREMVLALSVRELEVLMWAADGKSSQDVADILNLSKSTVDFHTRNAIMKLGATNKTSAVVRAVQLGLFSGLS